MYKNQKRLSDYIDSLNADKKPKAHGKSYNSSELDELFHTVRRVRSLKKATMPDPGYPKRLAKSVHNSLTASNASRKRNKLWLTSAASIAAILIIVFAVNLILPLKQKNIVYAMEEAFEKIKAYHGFIEIIQTTEEGQASIQSKIEVWADNEGHYYVKGLEGPLKDLITVNNGEKKWQIRPNQKEVYIFPAFPDPYTFTFDIGSEIEDAKNALSTKPIGEDTIAGRKTTIVEVTPDGGNPYKIWVDKETNLPLQRQSTMHNALQYTIRYTEIEFSNAIPEELMAYNIPEGFKEINTNPEQIVNNMEEAQEIVGFTIEAAENLEGFVLDNIAVLPDTKLLKLYYTTSSDNNKKVVLMQRKSADKLQPASNAILGKINSSTAEIQSPVHESLGVLAAGRIYDAIADTSSIRWQKDGFEYAVVGNIELEKLTSIVENLTGEQIEISSLAEENKPEVEVSFDLAVEENTQKIVDGGSSPWRLDPVYTAQVFVSLEMSPEGIVGDYPIDLEDLTMVENTGTEAIVEVSGDDTPIRRVYLKRLVRQDSTGIWTVVGYDPVK